jgi:hypothetical protein
MAKHARGRFEVKLTPASASPEGKLAELGRMSNAKTFSGDLEGRSTGEMLAFRSSVEGSAGYVAIERVDGALEGRRGTFVLQHDGRMNRGQRFLSVVVVPDSATGELVGLSGKLDTQIEKGEHSYDFEYEFVER